MILEISLSHCVMSKKEHELILTCVLVIANFGILTTRADDDVDLYLVSRIKAIQDKDGNIIIAKADTNAQRRCKSSFNF